MRDVVDMGVDVATDATSSQRDELLRHAMGIGSEDKRWAEAEFTLFT